MIDKVKWLGNSNEMFNIVVGKVPMFFRGKLNRMIRNYIIENNIRKVTEEMIIEAVKEYTPKKFLDDILNEMEKYRTEE